MNSKEFIKKFRKKLESGPDFFNPDTSLMSVEQFEKAKCKLLVIFPSPHTVKTVSSTAAALNDFVIEHCPDTFIDFAYMPEGTDIKLYDEHNMPYAIGNITHLDASHFDMVGFSISVLSEIVTAPVILKSFERCDKPIPLFWSDRKDMKIGETPIIYTGGITAVCGDVMFGKVGDKQSYIDFQYLGSCDKTDILCKRLIEAIETGKVTRSQADHDIPGYAHEEIPNFEESIKVETVQDYIESLFDLDMIYQPQAYEVKFNKYNQIISNKKVNPKARDFVRPFYPHILPEDLGIGRAIINANGDNTGTTQTQVAEGCSAAGACSFRVASGTRIWTNTGIRRIETVNSTKVAGLELNEACKGAVFQGKGEKVVVTTKDGHVLECDKNHKWLIVENDSLVEKRTWELYKGDVILRRLGSEPNVGSDISPELGEFLGFMHGDGCFGKAYGRKTARWKIYMTEQERLHYEALFRKFVPTKANTRIHYKSDSATIYVLEGNAVDFGFDIAAVSGQDLYVPDCIFNSSDIVRRAYLRGIFQADGYYTKDLGMTTVSKKYAQDIALLLASVGIDSTIRTNGYFERNNCSGHKISFYIRIPASFEEKFIKEIGFVTKNHESSRVEKRTKANLLNLVSISDTVRSKLHRDDARDMGLGQWFERPDALISDESWRSLPDWVTSHLPETSVRRMVASGKFVTDSIDSVINTGETVDMYDVVDTESSWCVYNDILTHNCAEGNYCGGWVEKSRERILWEIHEAKKYSAGYKYKPYSFNCLKKGTLIPQSGGRLTEIENATECLGWKGMGEFAEVSVQKCNSLIRVETLRTAFAEMTPNHRQWVLTSEGLKIKFAKDLVEGDYIPYYQGYNKKFIGSPRYDEYYLLGLWFGDGVQVNEYTDTRLLVCSAEHELVEWCKNNEKFFKSFDSIKEVDGHYTYVLSSEMTELIKSIFPVYKYGKNNLTNLTLEQSISFIRGWMDADGASAKDYTRIVASVKSEEVLNWAMVVLTSAGFDCTLSKRLESGRSVKDEVLESRYLSILGKSRAEFVELIPSILSKKNHINLSERSKISNIPGVFGLYAASKGLDNYKELSGFLRGKEGISPYMFSHLDKIKDDTLISMVINDGLRFSKITSVEYIEGEFECVDLVETSEGSYLTGFGMTHNTNYVTDYKGMLAEFIAEYPKVTFINMRLEELGRDTDALKMMKLIGSNRISAPIEGISPRIQNNLLNKCLSEEALMNFMNDMVHLKMTDIKVGGIFTGYEEDEDFQWICDFVDRFKGRATEEGGNFPFRLKVTPLVHYPLTPCEYLERKSARKSFEGEHWLTDEWYEKFREHQVFFKVNGFRYSTFLEQSFVDLGRELTPLIHKHFVETCEPIYSLRSVATEDFIKELQHKVNPYYGKDNLTDAQKVESDKYMECYFGDREPEHYISPSHRVHIELMGSYIPRARRLVRAKKAGNIFANEADIRCLKTYEGAKVKCYANCIKADPLKIYHDVEMNENGVLSGDYRLLNGCERCQTPEQRKDRIARPTPQTKNSEDIMACPRIPQVQKIRFVLRRDSEFDVLNPNNTAHTFVTKFLQKSATLLDAYHSIQNHNLFWQADPQFKYFCSGLQIVDTMWSKSVLKEVQDLIPEINKELQSVQIISAQDILRDEKLLISDLNVFYFETSLPMELLDLAKHHYKGEIKVDGGMQTFALTTVQDKELVAPIYAQKGKVCGFFTLPAKYNPLSFMSGYMSNVKKMGLDAIAQNFTFDCVMTMRETKAVCKNCGKETALVSLVTGKPMPFGKSCLCKALLTQKLK